MKQKALAILVLIKEYFSSVGLSLAGKNIKKWNVFYIGQLGVTQLTFLPGSFSPQGRLFLRAEKVPGLPKGTLNDVYNQMKIDHEHRIALYVKEAVDSQA